MKQRVLAASLLIPIVLAAIFFLPFYPFLLLIGGVIVIGARELFGMLKRYGMVEYRVSYLLLVLLPWMTSYAPSYLFPFLLASLLLIACWSVLNTSAVEQSFPSVAGNAMSLIYVGIPLSLAAGFHPGSPRALEAPELPLELLMILLTVWMGDSFAYFVGKRWGKRHITPRISPNKSLEGFVAAILGSLVIPPLFGAYFLPNLTTSFLVAAGFFLGAGGIMGDLFESLIKRGAGIKDSSHLIPGHGGLLDRIDSILFAVPIYYLASILID
ncbi:MAG TPA: phosphatidate cytidylyltransferase [Acidobacteriota bacterium]|nr:phosphatidate cytidylyltransferase [Acidobacteriota bacterium]